jgi:predicted nucleic acid-binding protein
MRCAAAKGSQLMSGFVRGGNLFWNARDYNLTPLSLSENSALEKVVVARVLCLDSSVLIPYLTPEEHSEKAERLILDAIAFSIPMVAPCFAWAEVGSVLRKKVRRGLLTEEESEDCFEDFQQLPLEFIVHPAVSTKAWAIATQYKLATLYDAAFLACAEHCGAEFWTADQVLIKSLLPCPKYIRSLTDS